LNFSLIQVCLIETNSDIPNLRHILYSIILLLDKLDEIVLIDRIYVERFQAIYDIWMLIDNEINTREKSHMTISCQKTRKKKMKENNDQKISWNFIGECNKYEKIFGTFIGNVK
jgi:hypothetical protein